MLSLYFSGVARDETIIPTVGYRTWSLNYNHNITTPELRSESVILLDNSYSNPFF